MGRDREVANIVSAGGRRSLDTRHRRSVHTGEGVGSQVDRECG
jgi:hypothetical protein